MPAYKVEPDAWTTVVLAENTLVEARGSLYITMDGTQPADKSDAHSIPAMESRVISSGLTINMISSNSKYSRAILQPI